ncbi:MAG: transposase [Actinobacteria bacterium]|nr:transposase [Actinomycetota bacterium]MBO0786943.1 transposase [Actinomycetota bacterium]
MRRAYKFRAYPTRLQQGRALRLLADHCDLYNAALQERRDAWGMQRASISYGIQSAQLREIRATDPEGQGRHSFTAQQQTLRRLNTVFTAFYRRAAAGKAGYPRFKPYSRFDQVTFVAGDGAKWIAGTGRWARASLQAVGSVKVHRHRPVPGKVKALQLKREHRRWYVIVIAEAKPVSLPASGRSVGVDLGVARFLTTSDGEVIANPRFLAASQQIIADLQRRKERARRGSGNRKRIRRQLAREWRRVRNRRRDFHHKTARALATSCDVIALEKLNTAGMTRRPAPVPDGNGGWLPNGASAKSGLNKMILDAGWAQFAKILAGKAESAGRQVIFVNPAGTSITCYTCGQSCDRPRQDTVTCLRCGPADADLNGARNIYARAGLGSGQAAPAV